MQVMPPPLNKNRRLHHRPPVSARVKRAVHIDVTGDKSKHSNAIQGAMQGVSDNSDVGRLQAFEASRHANSVQHDTSFDVISHGS